MSKRESKCIMNNFNSVICTIISENKTNKAPCKLKRSFICKEASKNTIAFSNYTAQESTHSALLICEPS